MVEPPLLDPPTDAAAFERLYRSTSAHVHSLARRLLGAGDADDATQEVYVRAWARRESYRGAGDVRGWLHKLALRALLNRQRDGGRRPPSGAAPDAHERPAPRQDADARLDLDVALAALPAGAREVFVLHDGEGLRHEEVAELLGVSVGTSKSQLHRARLLLRRALVGPPEGAPHVRR